MTPRGLASPIFLNALLLAVSSQEAGREFLACVLGRETCKSFVEIFGDIFLQLSGLLATQMQESGINLDFDQILDLESADLSGISSTDWYEIVSKPIIGRWVKIPVVFSRIQTQSTMTGVVCEDFRGIFCYEDDLA